MKTNQLIPALLIAVTLLTGYEGLNAQENMHVTTQKFIAYSLYNFSKLIDWPSSSSATTFQIAVVGDKQVYDELSTLAKNKKVGNATYEITFCKSIEELNSGNQIIYLSNTHSGKVKDLSKNPNLKNVLLVTEREGMSAYGSAICFTVTDQGNMGFQITRENAKKNQLTIRTQLERMALQVI
jgi:hypothetical protein